jgi:hypothetical protein
MEDKSGNIPIGGILKPQAIAAAGNATGTVYVDASKAPWFVALCAVGAGGGIGSALFSIVQATDSSGTGVKALVSTPASLTLATDNTSGVLDVDPTAMDFKNGFTFFAVKCAMTGGTNSIATAIVVACDGHYLV